MVRDNGISIEEHDGLDAAGLAWSVNDRGMEDFDPADPYKNIDPEILACLDEELKKRGFPNAWALYGT